MGSGSEIACGMVVIPITLTSSGGAEAVMWDGPFALLRLDVDGQFPVRYSETGKIVVITPAALDSSPSAASSDALAWMRIIPFFPFSAG